MIFVHLLDQIVNPLEKKPCCSTLNDSKTKRFQFYTQRALCNFCIENAYNKIQETFTERAKNVHVTKVLGESNTITGHSFFKCKEFGVGTENVKARIASLGNKDEVI